MPALLGSYQLVARIAVGGMAEVFLARKTGPAGFEKRVAIKRLLPHLCAEPDFIAMFLDEARLASRLDHPHVVHIHDFGIDGTSYYLAMEHVAGEDVRAICRQASSCAQPIPFASVAALVLQACEGLHHAHEHGVIHRDVTPSNLLVSYEGVLKVADFGIAKATERSTHTVAGALKGKIPYMSPEQASGRPVDRRTDVYSLGVCAWELVAGRRLFDGADKLDTLKRVQAGTVTPLSSARPEVPPALAAILARALEPDPDARWPTARAFGEALGGWLAETGQAAASTSARIAEQMNELFGPDAGSRLRELSAPAEPTQRATVAARSPGARRSPLNELARVPLGIARLPGQLARMPLYLFAPIRLAGAYAAQSGRFADRVGAIAGLPRWRLLVPLVAFLLSGGGLLVALEQHAHPPAAAPARPSVQPIAPASIARPPEDGWLSDADRSRARPLRRAASRSRRD